MIKDHYLDISKITEDKNVLKIFDIARNHGGVVRFVGRLFLSAKPHNMLPHRMGELIQFNYLLRNNVINFDNEGLLNIDFENLEKVLLQLLDETIAVQLSKSPQTAENFVNRYTEWSEVSERIAAVHRELGIKPYKRIVRHF